MLRPPLESTFGAMAPAEPLLLCPNRQQSPSWRLGPILPCEGVKSCTNRSIQSYSMGASWAYGPARKCRSFPHARNVARTAWFDLGIRRPPPEPGKSRKVAVERDPLAIPLDGERREPGVGDA